MTDVNSDLWTAFSSLVEGAVVGKNANEQVLPMLVALPLEADWFDPPQADRLTSTVHPADAPLNVLAQQVDAHAVEAVLETSAAVPHALAASGITIPDPDDLSAFLDDSDVPAPGTSLTPATIDPAGDPTGRPDPMYAGDSKTKARVTGLTRGQQNFLEAMAFLPGQYGPLWAPGSVRAADAYKSLLLNISIGDMTEAKTADVRKAFTAFSTSSNGYSTIQLAAATAYQTYASQMRAAGMTPDPIGTFLVNNGYRDQLAGALTTRNADYARFRQVVQDAGLREDLIDAVSALQSDLPQLFVMSAVADPPTAWSSYSQTVKHGESHSSTTMTSWGVGVSGMYNFISLGGSASGSSQHETVSTSEIDMTIDFAGIKQVFAIPGVAVGQSWTNNAVVSKYVGHRKDNAQNSWASTSVFVGAQPSRDPYGAKGFLPFWPVGAVVVYKPTITLTMATTSYDKNATSWKAGVDIGIGPFKFSPSAGHSKVTIDQSGDSTSITLTDTSTTPKVLAFLMQVMPPGAAD